MNKTLLPAVLYGSKIWSLILKNEYKSHDCPNADSDIVKFSLFALQPVLISCIFKVTFRKINQQICSCEKLMLHVQYIKSHPTFGSGEATCNNGFNTYANSDRIL